VFTPVPPGVHRPREAPIDPEFTDTPLAQRLLADGTASNITIAGTRYTAYQTGGDVCRLLDLDKENGSPVDVPLELVRVLCINAYGIERDEIDVLGCCRSQRAKETSLRAALDREARTWAMKQHRQGIVVEPKSMAAAVSLAITHQLGDVAAIRVRTGNEAAIFKVYNYALQNAKELKTMWSRRAFFLVWLAFTSLTTLATLIGLLAIAVSDVDASCRSSSEPHTTPAQPPPPTAPASNVCRAAATATNPITGWLVTLCCMWAVTGILWLWQRRPQSQPQERHPVPSERARLGAVCWRWMCCFGKHHLGDMDAFYPAEFDRIGFLGNKVFTNEVGTLKVIPGPTSLEARAKWRAGKLVYRVADVCTIPSAPPHGSVMDEFKLSVPVAAIPEKFPTYSTSFIGPGVLGVVPQAFASSDSNLLATALRLCGTNHRTPVENSAVHASIMAKAPLFVTKVIDKNGSETLGLTQLARAWMGELRDVDFLDEDGNPEDLVTLIRGMGSSPQRKAAIISALADWNGLVGDERGAWCHRFQGWFTREADALMKMVEARRGKPMQVREASQLLRTYVDTVAKATVFVKRELAYHWLAGEGTKEPTPRAVESSSELKVLLMVGYVKAMSRCMKRMFSDPYRGPVFLSGQKPPVVEAVGKAMAGGFARGMVGAGLDASRRDASVEPATAKLTHMVMEAHAQGSTLNATNRATCEFAIAALNVGIAHSVVWPMSGARSSGGNPNGPTLATARFHGRQQTGSPDTTLSTTLSMMLPVIAVWQPRWGAVTAHSGDDMPVVGPPEAIDAILKSLGEWGYRMRSTDKVEQLCDLTVCSSTFVPFQRSGPTADEEVFLLIGLLGRQIGKVGYVGPSGLHNPHGVAASKADSFAAMYGCTPVAQGLAQSLQQAYKGAKRVADRQYLGHKVIPVWKDITPTQATWAAFADRYNTTTEELQSLDVLLGKAVPGTVIDSPLLYSMWEKDMGLDDPDERAKFHLPGHTGFPIPWPRAPTDGWGMVDHGCHPVMGITVAHTPDEVTGFVAVADTRPGNRGLPVPETMFGTGRGRVYGVPGPELQRVIIDMPDVEESELSLTTWSSSGDDDEKIGELPSAPRTH
jgi:hypothetical protein